MTMTVNEKIAKWIYPDCNPRLFCPDFQNDFNACLKWAVPKLKEQGHGYLNIGFSFIPDEISCEISSLNIENVYGEGKTVSEAFTDALEKLISEEKK